MGWTFSFARLKRFLWLDGGDGYATMYVIYASECTLKNGYDNTFLSYVLYHN